MKSSISIILILFCFSFAFSQQKTASDTDHRVEIEKLKKEIFALPVDEVIDTTANYQLIYRQTGGWSAVVGGNNFKKYTYSNGIKIRSFSYSREEGTRIYSGAEINKGMFSLVDSQLARKIKKDRFKDTDLQAIVSFGGEYLIKVIPYRYVGSATSYGAVTYLFYQKLKN